MPKSKQDKLKKLTKRAVQPLPVLFKFLAIILLTIVAARLYDRYFYTTSGSRLPDANQTVTVDTDEPSETKPSDLDSYKVPADQPRLLTIDSISVRGPIQKVGTTSSNAVSVPNNIHFAGWYDGSPKPGDKGISIIDGHVSGRYEDGIFKNLKNLQKKDTFTVEYGDGSIKEFAVIDVVTVPADKASGYLFRKQPNVSTQLNLITCGGKFNKDTQLYDDRVIAYAKAL